jgi:hypothetical protein
MSDLSIEIPDSLHRDLREIAEREGVSVETFIAVTLAEKVSLLRDPENWSEYMDAVQRLPASSLLSLIMAAKQAERPIRKVSRERYLELLDKAPDVEPEPYDKL